ncbi:MAG TPA: class III extradiol ring-cleavage dioxygenase [Arenicellales bacterium]|nr:class III extradiol ring-cleavage dioxygenase [Arenicellales bacterium]
MSDHRMPSLFVSHGAPTLAVEDGAAHRFLTELGDKLERPEAILMLSAHYEEPVATVTAGEKPETIHDFGGFPRELYRIQYPAPGSPALADAVAKLLGDAGWPARRDPSRGLDHGAWVPLRLMYPEADIPVVQLSIDSRRGAGYHYALGELLRPLRDDGVLVIGSGGATHNLRLFFGAGHDDPPPDWVRGFSDWVERTIAEDRRQDLIAYRSRAPHAADNHPTEEHFMPLLAALGAAHPEERGERIHSSHTYGILMMDAYQFGGGTTEIDAGEPV